jgi:hypothetical protein
MELWDVLDAVVRIRIAPALLDLRQDVRVLAGLVLGAFAYARR